MNIRLYKESDWSTIKNWWIIANEIPPLKESMTNDSTFVLEKDNDLLASITVYLTNSKEMAYLENLVRNPEFKNKEAIKNLVNHAERFTKENGYKRLICFSYKSSLKKRYENLGYLNTLSDLSSFVKELN